MPAAAAILLILTACAKQFPVKNPLVGVTGNFETEALISFGNLDAAAKISQDTPFTCSVEFQHPKAVAGMEFVFSRDEVLVTYKGMSFTYARDSMPPGAAANLAVSAISAAKKDDGLQIILDGGEAEITGMIPSGEFSLVVDKDTGEFLKLSHPSKELEIEFNNFRFLD